MDSWSEVPDHYKLFSRLLNKVLDRIVFSPVQRDQFVKFSKTWEIVLSFWDSFPRLDSKHREDLALGDGFRCPVSRYICGSKFEGTTSVGLNSDTDFVRVLDDLPVVTNIIDAQQYQNCLLLIQDPFTPAGYAKLQVVYRGVPGFDQRLNCGIYDTNDYNRDAKGRLVVRTDRKTYISSDVTDHHGPAATIKGSTYHVSIDTVIAHRCKTWPDCAGDWLTRQRHHNWPTQATIEKCKTLGCFFVRVGHPNSREKHLEWRISFSLQERLLVTDFNAVQFKCYVLLKMIKREKIHIALGEKSLTSYHFKTCMLYMIENTPAEFWVEDNLLVCLYIILYIMLRWVEAGECPNYFIPKENMFEGRLSSQLQVQLSKLLGELLSMDFKFLFDIKCDMLGERLQEALAFGGIPYCSVYPPTSLSRVEGIQLTLLRIRNFMFKLYEDKHPQVCFLRMYKLKSSLEKTEIFSEDTPEALSFIVSYIDIMLMSILIVLAKRLSKNSRFTFTMISEKWDGTIFDLHPSELKLKQASLMYMLGHCKMSLEILMAHEDKIRHSVSVCSCEKVRTETRNYIEKILTRFHDSIPSTNEIMTFGLSVVCLVFLPAEAELTPLAVCYEMYRSVGSPPEGKKDWYHWAVVDGNVLLYFLLYLNHQQLGMEAHAAADTDKLSRLIQTDEFLGHRETAYNLLGWIYKERGLVDKAMECFQKSLTIKPTHNSAVWQLAYVLSAKVNGGSPSFGIGMTKRRPSES